MIYTCVDKKKKNLRIQIYKELGLDSRTRDFFRPKDLEGSPKARAASPTASSRSQATSPIFLKKNPFPLSAIKPARTYKTNKYFRLLFPTSNQTRKEASFLYQRRSKWSQNGRYTPTQPMHQTESCMWKQKFLKLRSTRLQTCVLSNKWMKGQLR